MSGVEVGLAKLEVEVQAEAETLIEKVEMKVILLTYLLLLQWHCPTKLSISLVKIHC